MKYKTKSNHVVKSIYRCSLRGNHRNAVLCLSNHRHEITDDLFEGVFEFLVEKTRLIDFVKDFDPYTRSKYYTMLDEYIKLQERRCKI